MSEDMPTPRTDAMTFKDRVTGDAYVRAIVCQGLERELAEANRRACEYYLTDESIMVMDSPEAVREARKKAAKRMIDMERELTEAREASKEMWQKWLSQGKCCEHLGAELHELKTQRDTLAEALRVTWADIDHLQHWMPLPCRMKSKSALAAVKGGVQ
jgi:hypothetical protein